MVRPARKCRIADPHHPDFDEEFRVWLRTELQHHKPVLEEYADPPINHQWWRGELYLAGFKSRDAAERYGRMQGWL